jgi:carboxylesterase type B
VYVFHSASAYADEGYAFSPDDSRLSWEMLNYWTTFAHTQPGGAGSATGLWPTFSSRSGLATMIFDVPQSQVTRGFNKFNCDYWDSIGYHF